MALVHFDSHPDTWDQYFGSKYFHGTMFRRAVEERLIDPRRTFQIAIRGPLYGSDDFDFQAEHGMTVVRTEAIKERGVDWVVEQYAKLRGAKVYVSFDIDAVDPAFAPGTGTPEVGGLTSYEALALVRGLRGLDFVGFDLVEVAPQYDGPGQITALLAANLLFEFLSLVALNLAKIPKENGHEDRHEERVRRPGRAAAPGRADLLARHGGARRDAPAESRLGALGREETFLIYSQADTPKLRNVAARPEVALHLDGDGRGGDIVIVTGEARIDRAAPPADRVPAYVTKYKEGMRRIGMTPESFARAYSVAVRVTPRHLRGH